MIPKAHVDAWRSRAPWSQPHQVEHDLILSRAIVEIFSDPLLRERLAFGGGTALYKLHLPPARYSEEAAVERRAEVRSLPEDPADLPATQADVGALRRRIGWAPETTLDEGVERMVAWAKGHPR